MASRILILAAVLAPGDALQISTLRFGLRHARVAMMSDEPMLQDAVASVFDAEECAVDAESEAERAACMEAPGEPYDYAGSEAPASDNGAKVLDPVAEQDVEECVVNAENMAEIQDCRSASAAAQVDEEGCEMIGETKDEVWFACKEGADSDAVDCEDGSFGTGGGPGILPQDGEVLCKAEKPK